MKSFAEELIEFGFRERDEVALFVEGFDSDGDSVRVFSKGDIKTLNIDGIEIFDHSVQDSYHYDIEEENEERLLVTSNDEDYFFWYQSDMMVFITKSDNQVVEWYRWFTDLYKDKMRTEFCPPHSIN